MSLPPHGLKEVWTTLLSIAAGIALITYLIKDYYTIAKLRLEYKKLKLELENDVKQAQASPIIAPVARRALETGELLSATSISAAIKAFLLCILIGGSGVGYVWQRNQIYDMNVYIHKRQIYLNDLRHQNANLSNELFELIQTARGTNDLQKTTNQ